MSKLNFEQVWENPLIGPTSNMKVLQFLGDFLQLILGKKRDAKKERRQWNFANTIEDASGDDALD